MDDIGFGWYNSFAVLIAVAFYFAVPSRTFRLLMLLAGSYLFYFSISGWLVGVLLALSLLDFALVAAMGRWQTRKRLFLVLSIAANLGTLAYFKYAGFFLEQFGALLAPLGPTGVALTILAPIGLSFIVFHGIGYAVDSYRGSVERQSNLVEYLLYVAFFPKVLAGPITRIRAFLPQLSGLSRVPLGHVVAGLELILLGLFKKLALAPFFFEYWNAIQSGSETGPLAVYGAGAAYGLFLLCDFGGYTDMARGVSRALGIELAENFDRPYASTSISEFWRRWHMSLSYWFRDYLYIPLGGSRRGLTRTVLNLTITMLLCGLWHGAAWTFVVWGAAHGAIMSIERVGRVSFPAVRVPKLAQLLITSVLLSATWVLFASPDLPTALEFLAQAANVAAPVATTTLLIAAGAFVLGALFSYFDAYGLGLRLVRRSDAVAAVFYTALLLLVIFQVWRGAEIGQFVYFRF
jgi:alginate O-acetyltransferase complex protein AlgI